MAKPLSWNTLEQAAKWLSEKTNEEWSETRVIDFAIEHCRQDDIVEDIKYPTYLQAILSESQRASLSNILDSRSACLADMVLCRDDDICTRVFDTIRVDGKEKGSTVLFKENLVSLRANEKTRIKYIAPDDQSVHSHNELVGDFAMSVVIYCDLHRMFIPLDIPSLELPSLPPVLIDLNMVGIREDDIKKLLTDYLETDQTKNHLAQEEELVEKNDSTIPNNSIIQQPSPSSEKERCIFSEKECLLFDPMKRKQIAALYPAIEANKWKEFFKRSLRNGLKKARCGTGERPYRYNPAKVGSWLVYEGKNYRQDQIVKILSKNLPLRSIENREEFLERRGLLD